MEKNTAGGQRKKLIIIGVSLLAALLLCIGIIAVLEQADSGEERETIPPIDPSLLSETKPEGFDIMEYDEYLALNRLVYFKDGNTGVTMAVDDEDAKTKAKHFKVMYAIIKAINEGDSETYNSFIGNDELKSADFTQQQIYDITLELYSEESKLDGGSAYDEVIYRVRYKIHENNGTYRNNIESDATRPQYFVLDDRTGSFLVGDIIETK